MDLSTLSNVAGARRRRKRVGRGTASGHGRQCGRGHKGQNARKGHKHKLAFEGGQMPLLRRLPKRGFRNPARAAPQAVNVGALAVFEPGSEVGLAQLVRAGLARADREVKILGGGALDRGLTVRARAFSAVARAKIEAAGGACEKL